tara:strand:+ start:259 stop:849 length:591 start_codon:yes stop_codon:yes gene_type:complete
MKYLSIALIVFFYSCKKISRESKSEKTIEIETPVIPFEEKKEPVTKGIFGDFLGNKDSVYVFTQKIDTVKELTIISFKENKYPNITISQSIGADLETLKLNNFKGDVLLVNAKLKDTNFYEYYLFVYKDSMWKQPVNRFAIHKSNYFDSLIPITNNPEDSTQLLRYYSVFNMDKKSEEKFTWKLLRESIPMFEEED